MHKRIKNLYFLLFLFFIILLNLFAINLYSYNIKYHLAQNDNKTLELRYCIDYLVILPLTSNLEPIYYVQHLSSGLVYFALPLLGFSEKYNISSIDFVISYSVENNISDPLLKLREVKVSRLVRPPILRITMNVALPSSLARVAIIPIISINESVVPVISNATMTRLVLEFAEKHVNHKRYVTFTIKGYNLDVDFNSAGFDPFYSLPINLPRRVPLTPSILVDPDLGIAYRMLDNGSLAPLGYSIFYQEWAMDSREYVAIATYMLLSIADLLERNRALLENAVNHIKSVIELNDTNKAWEEAFAEASNIINNLRPAAKEHYVGLDVYINPYLIINVELPEKRGLVVSTGVSGYVFNESSLNLDKIVDLAFRVLNGSKDAEDQLIREISRSLVKSDNLKLAGIPGYSEMSATGIASHINLPLSERQLFLLVPISSELSEILGDAWNGPAEYLLIASGITAGRACKGELIIRYNTTRKPDLGNMLWRSRCLDSIINNARNSLAKGLMYAATGVWSMDELLDNYRRTVMESYNQCNLTSDLLEWAEHVIKGWKVTKQQGESNFTTSKPTTESSTWSTQGSASWTSKPPHLRRFVVMILLVSLSALVALLLVAYLRLKR